MQPTQPGLWVKPDGSRVYLCSCCGPCEGRWTELKTSKQYNRHAKHRLSPEEFLLEQGQAAAAGGPVPGPMVPHPAVREAAPPGRVPAQIRPAAPQDEVSPAAHAHHLHHSLSHIISVE